jgi:hypothetical protein
MGGFIALTMAARHASTIRHAVIVVSKASGPELANPANLSHLDPNVYPAVPLADVFPQGELDTGKD